MPHKVDGEWAWGNLRDKDKDSLRKKVWGVWKSNGSKGDFGTFWETGKTASIPEQSVDKTLSKKRIYHISGYDVFLVDGGYVREFISDEFTGGGNPFAHKFVPEGEIWLESEIMLKDRMEACFIIIHELWEMDHMRMGMDYDESHCLANMTEKKCRKAFGDNHGEALDKAGLQKMLRKISSNLPEYEDELDEWLMNRYLSVKE